MTRPRIVAKQTDRVGRFHEEQFQCGSTSAPLHYEGAHCPHPPAPTAALYPLRRSALRRLLAAAAGSFSEIAHSQLSLSAARSF